MRVCSEPNCPTLIPTAGRCEQHTRERNKARGTHASRGYGYDHVKLRREWAPKVATGTVKCWRCQELISSTEPWDLGHADEDRSQYRGPEHANRCNRSAAGRASHR